MDLLESSISCGLFAFTNDQAARDEISVHLMTLFYAAVQLFRKTKGRARKESDKKRKTNHIYKGQIKSVRELYDQIEFMTHEIKEWKNKEKVKLYEDFTVALNEQRRVSEEPQRPNKELEEYAKNLGETIGKHPTKEKWFLRLQIKQGL